MKLNKLKKIIFIFFLILNLNKAANLEATALELTEEDHKRLARGEVIVYLRGVGGPIKEGLAIGIINALPERVFKVITDNEDFEQFMPYVEQSDVEYITNESIINYQYLNFPFPIGDRYYKLYIVQAIENSNAERIFKCTWTYVKKSGNIKDTYGSWVLKKYGENRTLATYTVYTDPGGRIPKWALNMATEISLPKIIESVRQRVQNSKYDNP
jgi:hypothetical protein